MSRQGERSPRLSHFIATNTEPILLEFEEFARTHTTAGESMDIRALRDHAAAILRFIALDLEEPQSERDQKRKSEGDAPIAVAAFPTAAERHGVDRADSGFTLAEMFSEYRALRASVLRLWTRARTRLDEADLQDLIRFNEAIDQALAESVTEYSTEIEHSREMFLAILGHDLRSPLGAVLTASSFLATEGNLTDRNLTLASRIRTSGERMLVLVSDLLDFTRSRLGGGIPIERGDTDIAAICRDTLEEIGAHHPGGELHFATSGDLRGEWDSKRISQALTNLVGNAVQHGAEATPIMVTARGDADEAVIEVNNRGAVIAEEAHQQIFNPFKRLSSAEKDGKDQGSMGLGLYIAQQIAIAHGGRIDVESSEDRGTTFRLHLPRSA
jgi:signal transduction histidine kinase